MTQTLHRHGVGDRPAALPDHSRFPALDGVRALAVTGVVLTHAAFWTGHYTRGAGTALLAHADIGVPLFFVLSGFLLSREWFAADAAGRTPTRAVAYFWRRGLRILPMYWVTVALALTVLPENRHATVGDWLRHLVLVQVYRPVWQREGLTQTWSLCTEAAFYLVLPLLALAVVRAARHRIGLAWAGIAVAGLLILINLVWIGWYHTTSLGVYSTAHYWLPTTISYFAVGIALSAVHVQAVAGANPARWAWVWQLGAHPGTCWTVAGGLCLLIVTPLTGSPGGAVTASQEITRNVLYAMVAGAFVWPAIFGRSRIVRATLGSRPMRYLGEISYSIFLLHVMILDGVMRLFGYHVFSGSTLRVFVTTFALTVAASALAHRLVDRPVARLRHVVPSRGHARRAPQTG